MEKGASETKGQRISVLFRALVLAFADSYYFTKVTFIRTLLLAKLFFVCHLAVIKDCKNVDWLIKSLHGMLHSAPMPQKSS